VPSKILYIISSVLLLAFIGGCSDDSSSDDNGNPNRCGIVEEIAPDDSISGRLEEEDCTAEQVYPAFSGGDSSFLDEYRVTFPVAGTLTITMRSTDVDSFLLLVDQGVSCSGGCSTAIKIETDSNGAGGLDALISTFILTAGTYGIQANSIAPGSGDYSLETTFTP